MYARTENDSLRFLDSGTHRANVFIIGFLKRDIVFFEKTGYIPFFGKTGYIPDFEAFSGIIWTIFVRKTPQNQSMFWFNVELERVECFGTTFVPKAVVSSTKSMISGKNGILSGFLEKRDIIGVIQLSGFFSGTMKTFARGTTQQCFLFVFTKCKFFSPKNFSRPSGANFVPNSSNLINFH